MSELMVLVEGNQTIIEGRSRRDDDEAVLSARHGDGSERRLASVRIETLTQSVTNITKDLAGVFTAAKETSGATLETVTVNVEVNAEGGISLIGSAKAGISGGIQLQFKL